MKKFLYFCTLKRFLNKTTIAAMYQEDKLLQDVSVIAQRLKELHNDAVIAYTPQVQNLCAKRATENEVGWMLDLLWSFAGDERILKLYKQVCRAYWKIYPKTIHIISWRIEKNMTVKA